MAAGTQTRAWIGPSRRRVPRFRMQAPLDVTVLRSGMPDTFPGRALNLCERGIGAVLAGELIPGETVELEVWFPAAQRQPLRTRARVRYQDELRCGLEFLTATADERATIQDWAKNARAETEVKEKSTFSSISDDKITGSRETDVRYVRDSRGGGGGDGRGGKPSKKRSSGASLLAGSLVVTAACGLWWWNHQWQVLEAGLNATASAQTEKPQAQVPAEVMQRLLVHRVEPVYPAEARQQNLQGVIALSIVVGRDGSVLSMHALNGPELLAGAAMDALRWWKFEPYRLNGEPATVETTVAVEFKR
jgi:TonB family protein